MKTKQVMIAMIIFLGAYNIFVTIRSNYLYWDNIYKDAQIKELKHEVEEIKAEWCE